MNCSTFCFSECVGSHGFNCTSSCPPSWYGALCRFQCSCPDDECDSVHGCSKGSGYFICITSLLAIFYIVKRLFFFIIDWIKMRFVLILVYRKVKSSIRSNWLQYKTKSIRVKSGWYLFSTGNNSCGYEICKYNFSTWQNWQYSTKVLNAR